MPNGTAARSHQGITTLTLPRFDDLHLHLRTAEMLKTVLPYTARYASRAIAMPNTRPVAVTTGETVELYRADIMSAHLATAQDYPFEPLMTIELRDGTTPQMVHAAHAAGAVAAKVYPRGLTTNSDHGLGSFQSKQTQACLRAMIDCGMLLLIHGEIDHGKTLVIYREREFLPTLLWLAGQFPDLKIVLEHISTEDAVNTVKQLGENVAATITAHHLFLTLNDVIGNGLQPHNGCMPMPKDFSDRDALIAAAISGNPKFFFGSDSAPHLKEKKECKVGACGVFTAPIVPELLAEVFEDNNALDKLEEFTSRFGAEFYGLPRNRGHIRLVREVWTVPEQCSGVVPFRAGETLRWRLL